MHITRLPPIQHSTIPQHYKSEEKQQSESSVSEEEMKEFESEPRLIYSHNIQLMWLLEIQEVMPED